MERFGLSQMIYRDILFASSVEELLNMGVFFLAFSRAEEERVFSEGKRGSAGSMVASRVLGERPRWGRTPSQGVVPV